MTQIISMVFSLIVGIGLIIMTQHKYPGDAEAQLVARMWFVFGFVVGLILMMILMIVRN